MNTYYINASILKESNCWRRFFWILQGHTPSGFVNHKMEYGSAFHRALRLYYGNKSTTKEELITTAMDYFANVNVPETDYRNSVHLFATLVNYFKCYQGNDNIDVINGFLECKFELEYTKDPHIVLCGTRDMIGTYCGAKCIIDHKVTALQPKTFFEGFELNIQRMFYQWTYWKEHNEILPFVVNGIFISKVTKFNIDNFIRKQFDINEEQLMWFDNWVTRKLNDIKTHIQLAEIHNPMDDFDLSSCEQKFGLCRFYNVCKFNPSLHRTIIESNYPITPYEPLKFQD